MISRRNIRVYVFQSIYQLHQQMDTETVEDAKKILEAKFHDSASLLTAVCHYITQLCDYVLVYANQKASKFITTQDDLNVNVKLASNAIVQQLKSNVSFSTSIKQYSLAGLFDSEFLKLNFLSLLQTPEYQHYLCVTENSIDEDKKILQFICKHCLFDNEDVTSFFSEKYLSWFTDDDMVEATVDKCFQHPKAFQFNALVTKDKKEFASELLDVYYDKKDYVFSIIEPKLVNWDAERVAIIDLILLHLGICEMLYFPSIPIKVTINEYIDLAKGYSTQQSGQFVNGLLDNVHKELHQQNKLQKISTSK
jgi:N utilization substance protein B